jgi:hypothetical protein
MCIHFDMRAEVRRNGIALCASASYIAVPAAMRLALPEANPGLYVTMALAITFPFNVVVGLPLYLSLIRQFWS